MNSLPVFKLPEGYTPGLRAAGGGLGGAGRSAPPKRPELH